MLQRRDPHALALEPSGANARDSHVDMHTTLSLLLSSGRQRAFVFISQAIGL